MNNLKKSKIAFHFQSEVQFFSLEPVLEELKKKSPYETHILIDKFPTDKEGYGAMANSLFSILSAKGYHPEDIRKYKNEVFDIYITSYIDNNMKAKCFLKYEYGTLNIKPSLTYLPEVLEGFHGFLCQSTVTECMLSAYGKTIPVDNLRFTGEKRQKNHKTKKIVLFAPTYNDQETEEELVKIIENLKKEYYVIVKSHHGTKFLQNNKNKKQILESSADEYYGSETKLTKLILKADVCLFGNSSAIAEALYANVPCAIFAHDLDYFKLGDAHTTQYKLVRDGIIPHCANCNKINDVIKKSFTKEIIEKQQKYSEEIYPARFKTGVKGYLDAIDLFLNDENTKEYIALHDYKIKDKALERVEHAKKIEQYQQLISEYQTQLDRYAKGKLYKLSDKLYKLEGKIIRGKN